MIVYREQGWSLFTIPSSQKLQLRTTIEGRTLFRSTGTPDLEGAKIFARRFRADRLTPRQIEKRRSFCDCARAVIAYDQGRIDRGERNRHLNRDQIQPLENHLEPFFAQLPVEEVTYRTLGDLVVYLTRKKIGRAHV